jgi:hypothetical protein
MVHMFEDDGDTFVIFEDIDSGTSVTNSSEQLASEIVNEYKLDKDNCRFFETYRQYDYETFDEIEYDWICTTKMIKDVSVTVWKAYYAKWKPAPQEKKIFGFE